MLSALWKLSAIVATAGQISQIIDEDVDPGIVDILEGGSGSTEIDFAAVGEQKPMISFTTTALAAALSTTGIVPLAITDGINFFFTKRAFAGGIAAGSVHMQVSLPKCMLIPKMLRADQGNKPATLQYAAHAVSADGTTAPLSVTVAVANPTVTPVQQLYTVGPVGFTVGSTATTLSGLQKNEFDLGYKESVKASDGSAYPTFACVDKRQSKASISGFDLSSLSTYGVSGTPVTAWKMYFTAIAQGGTRIAAATASHIKISGTTGMLRPDKSRASHDGDANADWVLNPTFDGANNTVVISTASAIT